MNSNERHKPVVNPVLQLAAVFEKSSIAYSYQKGWQLAQRMLEQHLQAKHA